MCFKWKIELYENTEGIGVDCKHPGCDYSKIYIDWIF